MWEQQSQRYRYDPGIATEDGSLPAAINNSSSLSRALQEFGHVKVASRPF